MISVSALGPLEIRRGGSPIPVPAGKTTALLIRLAVDANVTVSSDRLIEDLWGNDAGSTGRNTLQSKISKLRRALKDPALVASTRSGYSLDVDPREVDALEVLRIAEAAEGLLGAGDAQAALDAGDRALSMFRGDVVLPDAGDGDWLVPYRARLEEVRLGLVAGRQAARLQLGANRELVAELDALVVLHPLRERLWELLITALYRSGRQADALDAYQRVKRVLADELGLDPGPALRRLEQQVLAQDAVLDPSHPPAGSARSDTATGNLPSMSASLIGRDGELTQVENLLAAHRLVEIVGPGGVGKTAIALAVGRRVNAANGVGSGGVWLARLESAVTPNDVIDAVIAALDVGSEAALLERLKVGEAVVILDNCEHVRDAAATLASRLLDNSPGMRVLGTSQVPLDVEGEVVFELVPLALSAAVELFSRRAAGQRPGRRYAGPDDAVADLCRSLDGLPLVIELAAARTRTLSIEEITRRLDDRFSVLSDPSSRRPERRRSLRSTIRWSYELLFPDDQRGLWALATFSDGAPLPAVEAVLLALGVPKAAAIDVVGRLASRSLVMVDEGNRALDPPDGLSYPDLRYRLLDSIRAFAVQEMAGAGWSDRAFAAHATWYAGHARRSTAGVRSPQQGAHLALARTERANIDAALAWAGTHDPELAVELATGFGWAWVVLGDSRGAERILTALDAAGDRARHEDRIDALLLAGWIEASTDRLQLAGEHVAQATRLAEEVGDVDRQARCCYYLAYVISHHGDFRRGLELTDRSRTLYSGLDRPWDQAANGLFAARAAISAGDLERSAETASQAQDRLALVDDPWLQVRGEAMLGELARLEHRFDDAVAHLARAAATSRRRGFPQTEAYQVMSLGRAQCQAGDYAGGAACLDLAVEKAESVGDVRLAALTRVHLGRVLRALGQRDRARRALESAAAWHRGSGGGEQAALGECLLAAMDATDRVPGAGQRLTALLDDARDRDNAPVEVFALDALARAALTGGDADTAGDLLAAADVRMAAASHFISKRDRTDAAAIRARLEPCSPAG